MHMQKVGGLEQLSAGMQGVLITTGDQERFCVSEAYSLLNEVCTHVHVSMWEDFSLCVQYADKLYGPEDLPTSEEGDNSADDDANGGRGSGADVEAAVAKEIERLKGKGKNAKPRRFQVVDSGTKHVVFIRCLEEVDPPQLVHHMLSDIASSGVKKSR